MKLADVFANCEHEIVTSTLPYPPPNKGGKGGGADTDISGIAYDSRKTEKGTLFVAIKGESFDGHSFIDDAIKQGAVAVVFEKSGRQTPPPQPVFIRVSDSRRALACISNNFYGRPSEKVPVIGITGTNGKTTITYLIKSILEAWTKKVGLIGTITYIIGDRRYPASHTTPESPEFQGLLAEMVEAGCDYVVSEVSSHALFQKRVDYTRFIVAVFTNLTRDHLDFHGTMEDYYNSKRRLFAELVSSEGTAVINVDDDWGRRLIEDIKRESKTSGSAQGSPSVITYGTGEEADVSAHDIRGSFSGLDFELRHRDKAYRIDSPLVGMPNLYNLLAAASAGIALGVPMDVIQAGLRKVSHIAGRLETVNAGQEFICIIDYAHTPDALERLLQTARELIGETEVRSQETEMDRSSAASHPSRRVITVFGCGGDRDRGKRPLMGGIATRLSDCAIITSDNPRSENPVDIIGQIVSGTSKNNYLTVTDRREAIIRAVEKARAGDVVIIAGKGHEDYQETGGTRHKFSDREVAEEAIRNKLRRIS